MARLAGWGNFPVIEGETVTPRDVPDTVAQVNADRPLIARGNGRSYGDAAMTSGCTVSMLALNKMISFDADTGDLVAEAGVLLSDVLEVFVPRGWFPPVTPGTKFVTLGGMIASDVHGKNHPKAGSFGAHVHWLDLVTSDGTIVRCSANGNSELFADTIGGMGLTGIIVRCCIRLARIETAFVRQRRIVAGNLGDLLDAFEETEDASYRVAWIDCLARGETLGRALLDLGEHAPLADLPSKDRPEPLKRKKRRQLTVPFAPPLSPLNGLTVRAFNEVYFRKGALAPQECLLDYETYFYPLDSILHWNRMYGRRGFAQYQCVLPKTSAADGLGELLRQISSGGIGSFLSVLKRLGPQRGGLSFPLEGYTLALDFPWSQRAAQLMDRLDDIVIAHGGRLYLTKDARVPQGAFDKMQPGVSSFRARRASAGASAVFQSLQSERLGL